MCNLHTEVDNNVEGTRFQQESVMYYRGISYKVLDKEKKASLYQAFTEESNTVL